VAGVSTRVRNSERTRIKLSTTGMSYQTRTRAERLGRLHRNCERDADYSPTANWLAVFDRGARALGRLDQVWLEGLRQGIACRGNQGAQQSAAS
jgi:hypothetical protein